VEDALDPHAEDEHIDDELKFTFPAELSVGLSSLSLCYRPFVDSSLLVDRNT